MYDLQIITINCFQQAKLEEVWNHVVIVELHYCKERFVDSPLCVTHAIVCSQNLEENNKMILLWEKFIFQENIFSSLNPFVIVLLASAVFCNSFNQIDSWACWPATILDFVSPISDHVTTKLKYIAFSLSPSFPGPPKLVDVTLVPVFYAPLDTDLNTIPVPIFSRGWLNIQAHKNLIRYIFGRGGGSGSHLLSWPGSLSLSPYKIKFQVIYSIEKQMRPVNHSLNWNWYWSG